MKKIVFIFIPILLIAFVLLFSSCQKIHVHTPETIPAVEASCTVDGSTAGERCSECGEILVSPERIPALGHEIAVDAAVFSTCTEDGLSEGKHCSVCGLVITEQSVVKSTGHKYQELISKAPTCTSDGTKTLTCSLCNNSYTETISSTGHSFSAATCETAEKCRKCGMTIGSPLGHTTCFGKCDRCGKEIVPKVTLDVPSTVKNGNYSEMKIKNVEYSFLQSLVIPNFPSLSDSGFTISVKCTAEKISDYLGSTGNSAVAFNFMLYDSNGKLINSGYKFLNSVTVGKEVKMEFSVSKLPTDVSEFRLVIESRKSGEAKASYTN